MPQIPEMIMAGMRIPCYHFTIERRLMAIDKHKPGRRVRQVKRWKRYTTIITDGVLYTQCTDREIQKENKGDLLW